MVVANEIVGVNNADSLPENVDIRNLAVRGDSHDCWTSKNEIYEFLEELNQELKLSRSRQSDACYIDPDNSENC